MEIQTPIVLIVMMTNTEFYKVINVFAKINFMMILLMNSAEPAIILGILLIIILI